MKVAFPLLVLTIIAAAVALGDQKVLTLQKTPAPIVVDGVIDPAWEVADSVTDFVEHQPYHGKTPSRRTIAKVLTTDEALYCLMVCYDSRENIQRTTGTLDQTGGDIVSIMLDTFGDKRTAYKFAVTASGVRNDCRLLDDARDRDYSWDGIWFSQAQVYDSSYVIEMEIPYKSIKYDKSLKEWGLDFDRWVPSNSEDIYWAAYEQNEGQRVSKFGRLAFTNFYPSASGLNLEVYPVGIAKTTMLRQGEYDTDPDLGLDIFYNPSEQLTFQLTANPDFAQIEADPFEFNISRYETYYNERRPFFTEGNEIFKPSGRQRNTGFYQPLELFYSRRIGTKLSDGTEVPLTVGTKAFGRVNDWEYGGFLALTGETPYNDDGTALSEPNATFGAIRLKKQVLGNSSIGSLVVVKHDEAGDNGVIDIDGAFRTSDLQLAYQVARSFKDSEGDFASSFGLTMFTEKWLTLVRGRYIGEGFDISEVGFVPWRGTGEFVGLVGPRWYFKDGYIREMLAYIGPTLNYEKVDGYTDHGLAAGFNMQLRDNWGYEINGSFSKSKDQEKLFDSYDINFSSWYNISPKWYANLWGGYSKTYNFSRDWLAFYSWGGVSGSWNALDELQVGASFNMFVEGNPENNIEDITYNARPYLSVTPINNLNIRVYVDNVYLRSSEHLERVIGGLLFSYNFSPKSWIYFALNEARDRGEEYDSSSILLPTRMHVTDRAGVLKVKYLYYW